MKKLILLALTALLIGCYSEEDPLKYKGCVVINKAACAPCDGNIRLKLSPKLRKKYKVDYIWIGTPKWEYDKLNIGDTIQ